WEIFKANIDPDAKVRAVIISHSHVDHYMGLSGVINPSDILRTTQEKYTDSLLDSGKVLVIAPNGFYEEAISENLYLGTSMGRRSNYMYGMYLPVDECGSIGAGLGKSVSMSTGSLVKPSFELKTSKSKTTHLMIDGLSLTFLDTPNTEAPAEFHIFFNDYKILCPGENISHTMHNLLTPRGAKVRDPKAFGKAIDKSIEIIQQNWKGEINAIIGVHHWPTWDKEPCFTLMEKQRDMYYFFNDQVIRLMNKGMNMEEIAEIFHLPSTLGNEYYNRGYYGTLNHNVKAVYQLYAGWWDGNPSNYFKYPDEEVAKRMVEDMGGERSLLKKAKSYFDKGDYRWTIELTKHLVFYNPKNEQARYLQADAFEQLAYACEAGTWRNIFLSAAFELRHIKQSLFKGTDEEFLTRTVRSISSLPPHYIFEYFSVLLDGFKADGVDRVWNVKIANETHQLSLKNGVLHHKEVTNVQGEVMNFDSVQAFSKDFHANMMAVIKGTEAHSPLYDLYQYFDTFNLTWNIIEPLSKNE
ncbi:MAG: MBL fold metallo-hydrolase, partial [Parabacteroides sp.]|nr:MBL fold metallo-hydrolase [Parabacteroides sp.]